MWNIFLFTLITFIVSTSGKKNGITKKYNTCAVSVLWDVSYDLLYKFRVKHTSIMDTSPDFFDAHFVVTSTTKESLIEYLSSLNINVIHAERTTRTMSGDNYKYFLTKLKLFDEGLMNDCEVIVYSDADMFLISNGFTGLLEECPEDADVCMTSQGRVYCTGKECCLHSPIMVANSGLMVLRNPMKVRDALIGTLEEDETVYRRDQHLFGHILCDTDKLNYYVLSDRWNANYDFSTVEDIRLVHYTAGPDLLNPRMVPLTDPAYNINPVYQAFRNVSFLVDPCYSQFDTCDLQEDSIGRCRTRKDACVDSELNAMAPYEVEENLAEGFDWMVCVFRSRPQMVFQMFATCHYSCDILPLVEEKCFTPGAFSIFYCMQYFTTWVWDTFVNKSYLVAGAIPACNCCDGLMQRCLCIFGIAMVGLFLFLRIFFLPVLIFSIIFVWYFKGDKKLKV